MAVIVQADVFQGLIRKIGYSVGLEDLVTRVASLTKLYVAERRLTYVSWEGLVVEGFGREKGARKGQKAATEHIADFFSTLNLVKLRNKELTPLQGLECCSILYRHLGEERFRVALQVVLTTYIIEADGDIFLNCMLGNFDIEESKKLLVEMVESKRKFLTSVIRQPALQRRILDVIDIKSQQSQRLDLPTGVESSPFARRNVPLANLTRKQPLGVTVSQPVMVSPDYMRKVLPTRRGWARGLDLVNEDGRTLTGDALLENLSALGFRNGQDPFLIWPFEADLQKLRIKAEDLNCKSLREWDLLVAVGKSFGSAVAFFEGDEDYAPVLKLLRDLFHLYKTGNSVAGALRHQLPVFVAQPCVVAICVALALPIPPLPSIVEQGIKNRTINFANIRGTEGGLVIGESQR